RGRFWNSGGGMKGWKGRICFKLKCLLFLPTKGMLVKFTVPLRDKAKEYADIQVMWEMIHSASYTPHAFDSRSRKRHSQWNFCFRPT
ncbi:hypothetical protein NMG60_11000137, partial [Bertholletia excelsa]